MSINLLLEMSRRSFRALDAAMNATGQNVANAETEGYARRRVVMHPNSVSTQGVLTRPPVGTVLGAGVSISTYERVRDGMLQRSGWELNAGIGYSDEEKRVLGALEGLFPTGSDGTLGTQLGQFWNAWRDLADSPTDTGARLALRSRASGLATTFNRLDADIRALQGETQTALSEGIDKANGLFKKIADLNEKIAYARHSGSPDLDAEDERERLVGQLSELVPVRVQEGKLGAFTVTVGGMAVVQDQQVLPLELDASGTPPTVRFKGTNVTYRNDGDASGRIGSWMTMLEETFPDTLAALDDLAGTLVRQVNTHHAAGFGLDGTTGVNFFHFVDNGGVGDEGVTAASIRLSDEVRQDSRHIAASAGDPTDPLAGASDSDIANAIAGLQDAMLVGGEPSENFVINLVSGIGARIERASGQHEARTTAATHVEAMERGVSGVSIEEEMTNLIQYQHAFQASARVLNTVQQMLDTLLSM